MSEHVATLAQLRTEAVAIDARIADARRSADTDMMRDLRERKEVLPVLIANAEIAIIDDEIAENVRLKEHWHNVANEVGATKSDFEKAMNDAIRAFEAVVSDVSGASTRVRLHHDNIRDLEARRKTFLAVLDAPSNTTGGKSL